MGENFADILQNRKKEYEAEKGRNLATKEDIAEITQKIEQVKSEVSIVNQWKQEHIFQREKRLNSILRKVEVINHALDEIFLLSHNSNRFEKLYELIDKLNVLVVEIVSDGDMIIVDYSKMKDINAVAKLVDTSVLYAKELSILAHNIVDDLYVAEQFKDLANQKEFTNATEFLKIVCNKKDSAMQKLSGNLNCKEPMKQAIKDYISWLKELNDIDALAFYNVNEAFKENEFK